MRLPVAVIGASGRSGAAFCRALAREGIAFTPVVRDAARWAATGLPGTPMLADLHDEPALRRALAGAGSIASCAHARHAPAILAAAPEDARIVLMGSTRRFSRWADGHGDGVRAGEAALLASGRHGVILHPTMIYGAQGEDNVQRLAALMRRLPLAPLPGGGRALVQPIHQDDVTACLLAALARDWDGPHALVIAGPEPLRYADFIAAVCAAAGVRVPPVVPVPLAPLLALSPLTRLLPGLPTVRAAELRRLTEDKAFDIAPMRAELGVEPLSLAAGLARTFGKG
ncbi:SDR family oxidoreductase [Roseomonas marmotae]|uniref:NADH-ubiquinone oxidoreductase n=1 Tax=Roseomonas marmotae TaxID=2768161 RepID=A0ABS3K8F4_9PROT|nr:NADH-ubiquinone oxidoreductase [Roseomonas marmotae]MBO1073754.1 NADH-ubiquinone oxidoreductase [Roseomonas marmotae]QTI78614.1 NADH-ubiquinone oxidoreductase [Roseomonas marmotae]